MRRLPVRQFRRCLNDSLACVNSCSLTRPPRCDEMTCAAGLIYELIIQNSYKGSYIIGNGPNISTVHQAAHILSESTKHPFIGMSVSEYDHGPKETAKDSVVIVIKSDGVSYRRTSKLFDLVENAGAHVFYYEDKDVPEPLSPITSIMPLMFMTYYLSKLFKIPKPFIVGNKITEV